MFRKTFVICSHDLPFCVAILCVVVGTQSHHATLTLFENLGSVKWPKLPGTLLDPTRGAYSASYEPPAGEANMLIFVGLWPMTVKLNLS